MEDISYDDDFKAKPKKAQSVVSVRYNIEQCKICGSYHLRLNKSRHNRTRKHKDANYLWHEMFEIK